MNKRQKLVQQQFLNDEEAVVKRLKTIYNQSLKDITKKVSELDQNIGYLQKIYTSVGDDEVGELAEAFLKSKRLGVLTPEEAKETLQSMIQSKVYHKNYQAALQKQVGGVLDKMHGQEFETVSDYLTECYENGFVGTMYDLQGQGIPLCFPLDQEQMVRAVQLDSKISKGLYTRLGEDVSKLKKKITAQVSRGIATGMSYQQVAQQLAGETKVGYNNAVRIARTEGHRIQCQAGMDACEKAKEKGADVVKQWDATLDDRTRESHVAVDGQIRELDKPFSNGLMFPGDPSGGAGEVINCRCALLQRARWALDEDELQTLQDRAEYFGLDKAETFEDYKQKYLKAAEQSVTPESGKYTREEHLDPKTKNINNSSTSKAAKSDILNVPSGSATAKFSRKSQLTDYTDDLAKVNPNWHTNKAYEWTHNCQRCVPTYEMRRRGFNVTAKPRPRDDDKIAMQPWIVWQNAKPMSFKGKKDIEAAMSKMGDGARVQIKMVFKSTGTGHTFIAEQLGGKTVYLDPQTGKACSEYFNDKATSNGWNNLFWRIDNLEPSDLIEECCE